ncbi:MAG TPA: GGDEF domain-containing protein [Pirellulales bacterium]|jgi:diguanylate cyclase (GGDEF)-like protein|nr:GGDEF domain-containing protein [Pirellulales bacterium]
MSCFALFDFELLRNLPMSTPLALAMVAFLGYVFGRHRKVQVISSESTNARRDMKRAQAVAKDLEGIAKMLRKSLARHHGSIVRFKGRVSELSERGEESAWRDLCKEVEEILGPTIELSTQIARAYDEIRQQSHQLMTFTEVRTDQLTGVANRRALDDTLKSWVAMKHRYELHFSIVILDIDHFKRINDERGHVVGDQVLQSVARLIEEAARETDLVTRFGGEEFVILMPQTDIDGACIGAERIRKMIEGKLTVTVSGGVAEAINGDTPELLLERADAAMYHAKAGGRNRVSFSDGTRVQAIASRWNPPTAKAEASQEATKADAPAAAEPAEPAAV